jgi:hypothetical protein
MPMNADNFDSLTERVLARVFEVSNTLGAGFAEELCRRALPARLLRGGLPQNSIRGWLLLSSSPDIYAKKDEK